MNSRELESNIQNLLEGRLDAEAIAKLQQVLREDPQAQEVYREYALLHHCLKFRAKGVDMLKVLPMEKIMERRRTRGLKQALAAAAVILLLGSLVLGLLIGEDPLLTIEMSPGSDVVMSHRLVDGKEPDGHSMAEGSRLELKRGNVELKFASGVHGFIKGPATMTLVKEGLIELESGAAWFEVPEQATGFQVRTDDVLLTDLGTEFGIITGKKGVDEAHVFKGRVHLLSHDGQHEEDLVAGQARRVLASGGFESINLDGSRFLKQLPDALPPRPMVNASASFTSSPQNVMHRIRDITFTSAEALSGFDPSGTDKLVVTLSHEKGSIDEVRYGSRPMQLAVQSTKNAGQLCAIYYLDQPGGPEDLTIHCSGRINGVGGSILALTKTAPGAPDDTTSESQASFRIRSSANALVIAAVSMNAYNASTRVNAEAPLHPVFDLPTGSNHGAAGFMWVRPNGQAEASFSGKSNSSAVVAAAFAAQH